ncbi:hypothetical protein GE061_015416 [Apolygus lucorum]|uniref:Uncharacterized protein n=1 Tax=Apolygus lucorum TaxID=248454 RepID=A0A8S9XL09_APOLU|nr:hypothetical protein GE061_015416 [Apolygus lucorum]
MSRHFRMRHLIYDASIQGVIWLRKIPPFFHVTVLIIQISVSSTCCKITLCSGELGRIVPDRGCRWLMWKEEPA